MLFSAFPISAEVVAVAGYVLLSAFLTQELMRGRPSVARRVFAVFTGLVAVNRLVYLASLVSPAAAVWWHVAEACLLVTAACVLLFVYYYGGAAYPREGRVVIGLTAAVAVVMIGMRLYGVGAGEPRYIFDHLHFVYELPTAKALGAWALPVPLLLAHIWAAVVLARKGWRSPADWPSPSGEENRARMTTGAKVLSVIFLAGAMAPILRIAEYEGWIPLGAFSVLLLLVLVLSVIALTTYAPEPTSLQFRLTAVSLSLVIGVLTLVSGILSQATDRAARDARLAMADQVRVLAASGTLSANALPNGVAYVLVRRGDQARLVTARPDLSLARLRADANADRSGRVLPSALSATATGPHWERVGHSSSAEWPRGALAPPERAFDAVAFREGQTDYEVGVPHAIFRAYLGQLNGPLLLLMLVAAGIIWGGSPLLFRGSLLRPIRRLRDGLAEIEAGALDVRVPAPANDELGELGRSFNQMAAALGRARQLEAEAAQKEARAEQLSELNAAKNQFFANVSHEFRTPLTLTLGPLDDVLEGGATGLDADARELLTLARRNARRLLGLVNQVLDVARMEAGAVELDASPLDLGALAADVAAALRVEADRKGIALRLSRPEQPVGVLGDAARLDQALINLVANAVKFTPTGGNVSVEVTAQDGTAVVAVHDTGPGIAPDELAYVFDRFYQAASAATSASPGTGIGLALAREVAELHGGTLDARSDAHGSTFALRLPRHDLADAAPHTETLADTSPQSPEAVAPGSEDVTTVLVVEDNDELRAYVRRQLEAPPRGSAYRVIEATDGEAGLWAAREHLPDAIVSDVMMPKLDGLSLVRALRADPATDFVPVVLLTARAGRDDRLAGLEAEADAYLTKPFDADELRTRVGALIASRQRLRERFATEGSPIASVRTATPGDDFLAAVDAQIETHLADPGLSVERLADAVGVSRGHLHRQLKATGRTPSAAIREARLARAAALLQDPSWTVSEVAYGVGFKSVSHFSRSFEGAYGARPSAYRTDRDAPA